MFADHQPQPKPLIIFTDIKIVKLDIWGIRTHQEKQEYNEETGEYFLWKREIKNPYPIMDVEIEFKSDHIKHKDMVVCNNEMKYIVTSEVNGVCHAKSVSTEYTKGFKVIDKLYFAGTTQPVSSSSPKSIVDDFLGTQGTSVKNQTTTHVTKKFYVIERLCLNPLENGSTQALGYVTHKIVPTQKEVDEIMASGKVFTQQDCWAIPGSLNEFRYTEFSFE